jgi:hypothetical protein
MKLSLLKQIFLWMAVALMSCMQLRAQVKIHGVLEDNRYDDGEQMKSEYVGWNAELGKGIFVVDNGLWTMTWDGATLSTPAKEPEVSVAQARTDNDYALWANDFNLMSGKSGAAFVDGKLITVHSRDEQSTPDEELFAVRKWDATTGNLESGRSDYYPKSATLESAGMAYNPVDGEVYGLFYLTGQDLPEEITSDPDYFEDQDANMTDGDAGYAICRIDLTTMKVYPITHGLYYYNFITFAINSEGRAFALTSGGSAAPEDEDGKVRDIDGNLTGAQLCEFDLTTGLMKADAYGHGTGYCSQYRRQAACFAASEPNKMYWIGYYNSGKGYNEYGSWGNLPDKEWRTNHKYDTCLYEVDITTGEATRLALVTNRCRFSALWIDGDDISIGSDYWSKDHTATGIDSVHNLQSTVHSYYNLNGQRVTQPTKGIYISNGKKVIVK